MRDPLLSVRGLTMRFGGLTAVDGVDMELFPGDLTGLIGPNGAGKTTFFNCLTGFYRPSEGGVSFAGEDVTGLAPYQVAKRGIGRTFQNLRIMPNMTVFDNVSIGTVGRMGHSLRRALWPFSSPTDRKVSERTWAILDRVGLADHAGELAANLSYGQRKHLEIARALATQPRLLILDEPAAGLGDTETAALSAFIRELSAEGLTILLVEHDMGLVMGICTNVVVLASGRKIAEGPPAAVQQDRYVLEAYLGGEECRS